MDLDHDNRAFFEAIPGFDKLLQDESFVTIPTISRQEKTPSTEDTLLWRTLMTPRTFAKSLSQYRQPQSRSDLSVRSTAVAEELRIFYQLGTDLNGFPDTLHGGIVATLLDDCMGLLLVLRRSESREKVDMGCVTAYLNTKFLRPTRTPGPVVVHARLIENKEDRKFKLQAEIRDPQNQVLAAGESLFIKLRAKI
ncbi:hypothetical protein N7468_005477 [Penicillium chermesinum]|uniref:Thioesterase domain-containing protein n=1 Tax=Penicillium chermesinum TaxID=63820 RepID=A0A9W9TN09_9EURO|nr:uncharacterized protein N7468_005477 [Penicillium chermesinum]KAJ5232521.1 hypothetical protein N7468_005477 [Penicillium chermesinum]KAJ6172175.1 hypothetical protein N7470_001242 [Penicillium chermesinum]